MILECCNVSKRFGKKQAVKELSFSLDPGCILGIIGPNGAGKSTLIKMLTGLIWPDSGSVQLNGHDVHKQHAKAMRRTGAIIEWPAFIPYLTARRNLNILSGGHGRAYNQKLKDIIDFVGLSDRLDDKVGTFSTGMKQRLGIALALLPDSEFIILDEPTNGLDPGGIIEIRTIIKDYNRQFGTSIILTSHMLGEIEQICHQIAVVNEGQLVAFGNIDELLHQEKIIIVACEQPDKALRIIKNARANDLLHIRNVIPHGNELHIEIVEDCAAAINQLLVAGGIKVSRLSLKQKKLEDFFMEQTTGQDHVA